MNKEQKELLDEAYDFYSKEYEKDNSIGLCLLVQRVDRRATYRKPDRKMFEDLCQYDTGFSEKWGLKIEERELNLEERKSIYEKEYTDGMEVPNNNWLNSKLTTRNIPTKLITITYNDKTVESYE